MLFNSAPLLPTEMRCSDQSFQILHCIEHTCNARLDMYGWVHTSRNETAAAMRVPRRFTPSLLSKWRRSNAAPRTLSANIPITAEPIEITIAIGGTAAANATELTTAAAIIPASVPCRVTPPSVPAGTSSPVVIRRARALPACPISLETVSAAASESVANTITRKTGWWRHAYNSAQVAATLRFANTWDAVLPSCFSAVPRLFFRAYPKRVLIQVSANTATNARNEIGPAASNRMNETIAPATAPDALTPRTNLARIANAAVTVAANAMRPAEGSPAP